MGKSNIKAIGIVLGIIAITVIATGVYFNYNNREDNTDTKEENVQPTPTASSTPTTTPTTDDDTTEYDGTVLDNSKIINKNENSKIEIEYRTEGVANKIIRRITPEGKEILILEIELGKDKRTVTLTINWGAYNLTDDNNDIKKYTVTLEKDVKDVYIVGFGQAMGEECALYLMEDGTVEYNKILDEIKETTTLSSSGPIEGVKDVDRIEKGESGEKDGIGWGINNFAIKKDGTFYDLGALLNTWIY